MNFVGHAEVARWSRPQPGFLVGAMLPDFLQMAGARPRSIESEVVAAGVANHHRVDAAFHGAPQFVSLCASGVATLVASGFRRGPARAVAHVGTELLLDGFLIERPSIESAYLEAIAWAVELPIEAALDLDPFGRARLHALATRLSSWGAPHSYREPTFVAERLRVALEKRPRLALDERELALLPSFLEERRVELEPKVDALLDEVRARLPAAGD